jgi:DNA-binding beta-propeller fold protein YncE
VDLSPDGSFGYVPERDQDTVAMLDTNTLKITSRVEFPEGSKPWMLRVSPDGREVWVQTASGSNAVLDARTLEALHTEELGEQPVTTAWSPDGRYNFVTHFADSWVAVMDPESGKLVKRLEVGHYGANVSFRPDSAYGYVAVTGEDAVAVVEMESLEVESRLDVGEDPMGLIVL